jgi:hypothetical protein
MLNSIIIIPGQALQSGFCIYIQEVLHDKKVLGYYVGMTGDNHYPSARSPFHRLAGHFDRASKTTQRQLGKAIDLLLKEHNILLSDLTIRMHYYPISGFEPITNASNKKGADDYFKLPRFATELFAYKTRRRQVLALENHVIWLFGQMPEKLLNRTYGIEKEPNDAELVGILAAVTLSFLI